LATVLQAWVITPIDLWQRNHFLHHRWFGNIDIRDRADTVFFTRQQY
jgi:fatty acid desaturase